jgi:protein-L-isoaspartate(D-aspartate) O-methyltransferase
MNQNKDPYARDRDEMVEKQIIRRGVRDQEVLEAMRRVPRHVFVPSDAKAYAYVDSPLSIGEGQTISQPYIVAAMTELLGLTGTERVLEIGTGSGYQTAVLAELASKVFSLERIPTLAKEAEHRLQQLGYHNIHILTGDGTLGCQEFAPYDCILVTAGAPKVPDLLLDQLADGGRLVIPVGSRFSQVLQLWHRKQGKLESEDVMGVVFVPLIGQQGWKD